MCTHRCTRCQGQRSTARRVGRVRWMTYEELRIKYGNMSIVEDLITRKISSGDYKAHWLAQTCAAYLDARVVLAIGLDRGRSCRQLRWSLCFVMHALTHALLASQTPTCRTVWTLPCSVVGTRCWRKTWRRRLNRNCFTDLCTLSLMPHEMQHTYTPTHTLTHT